MKYALFALLLFTVPAWGQGTITWDGESIKPPNDLPACAFGLSRVQVLKKEPPLPSLGLLSNMWIVVPAIYITPSTRWACPYERAIALYGDERVVYATEPARVSVCDEDGKSNCVMVYQEKEKTP